MKKAFLLILFAFPLLTTLSCDKENDSPPEPEQDLTLEEALVGREWKMYELRFLQANTQYYYKRGVTGDPGWDQDKIIFNSNKTGTYWQSSVNSYSLTWDFTDSNKDEIAFAINYSPTPLNVVWENFTFAESFINYTEYYTQANGTKSLGSFFRKTQ